MKKRCIAILMNLLLICYSMGMVPFSYAQKQKETTLDPSQLYAKSAVLLDGESGRVLYEKNGYHPMPMASTTKIMTCIVVLEEAELNEVVTVSKYAASMPDVQLNIREKEKYYVKDLLYSLMLESHNDSSVALAEHVGGSVEGFAKRMNQKAKEIGCKDTYFITPNGLDATDDTGTHSTTARDLAVILKYCMKESVKKEDFLEITQTASYSFQDIEKTRSFSCNNHNAFLNMMEGAVTGKTGFTGNAGYCYVGALKRGDKTLIVALLACGWPNNKTYKWSDTKKLMNYGLEQFHSENIYQEKKLQDLLVRDGIPKGEKIFLNGTIRPAYISIEVIVPEEKKVWNMLLKEGEQVTVTTHVPDILDAPIEKGTQVGSIEYCLNGEKLATFPVIATDSIQKINFKWCFYKVFEWFLDEH